MSAPLSFETVNVGSSSERTLLVRNLGNAPLTLGDGTGVGIEGDDAAQFTIAKQPDSPIDPGKATTITIAFKPSASGPKNADLVFATNDSDEKTFASSSPHRPLRR